jgi:hypothetical protein
MTLSACAICEGISDAMREHCRYCGARRIFIASHSYESYRVVVKARDCVHRDREIVRAFCSTFCSDERAQLEARTDDE